MAGDEKGPDGFDVIQSSLLASKHPESDQERSSR